MGTSEKQRYRNHIAIINNYTDDEWEKLKKVAPLFYIYFIMNKEIGKECRTPHIHFYGEFAKGTQKTVRAIRKYMPERIAWIKPRLGSPKEAAGYLKKAHDAVEEDKPPEGWSYYFDNPHPTSDYYEWGKINTPGERKDLDTLGSEILQGNTSLSNILVDQPTMYHQYGRTLQALQDKHNLRQWKTWEIQISVRISKQAKTQDLELYDPDTVYIWQYGKWHDLYNGQPIIIMRNYHGQITKDEIDEMVEPGPFWIQKRYGQTALLAKYIIIHLKEGYPNEFEETCIGDGMEVLLDGLAP